MFSLKRIVGLTFLVATVMFNAPSAYAAKRQASFVVDDDVFQALRDAARRDDAENASALAARLPNYSIPSYVDYYRLKARLRKASYAEVREFLKQYDGSAIADRLRNDWLLEVGRKRDWVTFDEQYPLFALDDDTQLKCYALMSKAAKGQNVVDDARLVLTSPKDYGDGCHALIATLAENGQFSFYDVWAQIRLAAQSTSAPAARRMAALTDVDEARVEQAILRPTVTLARGPGKTRESHQLYVIALGRAARSGLEQAAHTLEGTTQILSPYEQALGWSEIALQASLKLAPRALADYWTRAGDVPLSNEAYQWRARMALRAGDWKWLKYSIEAMPPTLRNQPTWIYWMARALKEEGKQEEAQRLYKSIADQLHFYGQLALEELGQKISVPQTARPISLDEITRIAANPGFQRALKFFEMNLRFEGVREWNWELRKMNERDHLIAAEFARQNNMLDRMVNTSDRTKTEVDFTQRYPSPFRDVMVRSTNALGLDMAWVYGLIRQESRFIMNARSYVGASGLMQLMPSTAHYVARKIGMHHFDQSQVNDTNVNIELGTNYLNMVLRDLDGSQPMATAAYNAGPGRPRAWRSTLTRQVEGAIFAETIPFDETRGYVKNVLSNATYYAALFEGRPQSLKSRLGTIAPKGFIKSDLP